MCAFIWYIKDIIPINPQFMIFHNSIPSSVFPAT